MENSRRYFRELYVAQCTKCQKWRSVATQEAYEDIRCKADEEPFVCEKKQNVTCDDPDDIEHGGNQIWVFDQAKIPKTPPGFKRLITLRNNLYKVDVYYIAPTGKKLRSTREVDVYLQSENCPVEFRDVTIDKFSFVRPKVMEHQIVPESSPRSGKRKASNSKKAERKTKTMTLELSTVSESVVGKTETKFIQDTTLPGS